MILVKDPLASYLRHKAEIDQAISRVMQSGCYLNGFETEMLEYQFAKWNGATAAVAVGSGTVALYFALQLYDIGPGDEVIMPAMAPVAVMSAITMTGATPVMCDVFFTTMALDPYKLMITKKTRAIVLVHPYGLPVDKSEFGRDIPIIEDCSHAHGAEHDGTRVGKKLGVFSCYPTKNLAAMGDAGLLTVNNLGDKTKLHRLRQYGGLSEVGINGRIDELQAAVLRVKLRHLDQDNEKRRKIARIYDNELPESLIQQEVHPNQYHVYHQYVVRLPEGMLQGYFIGCMKARGIQVQIHYDLLPNEWNWHHGKGDLRNAEELSLRLVSLPIYPEMTNAMIEQVIEAVNDILV